MKKTWIAATCAAIWTLCGCTRSPGVSAVDGASEQPVRRYDIVQALATNGQVVVGATQDGAALVSRDAGRSWQRRPLGPASILGLTACPDGSFVGIDFYHRVWSADARGSNWLAKPLETPRTPLTVACDAHSTWWVAGTHMTVASSSDRGATWKVVDLGQDAQITSLQFLPNGFGVAFAEFGVVLTTTDGGVNWVARPKIPNDFYPYTALFTNERDGWVSGIAGQILVTHDGARTWKPQNNETRQPLFRLFVHHDGVYGTGGGGVLARLEGDEWREVAYGDPIPAPLGAATSVESASAIVVGGPGGLLRTIGTPVN